MQAHSGEADQGRAVALELLGSGDEEDGGVSWGVSFSPNKRL